MCGEPLGALGLLVRRKCVLQRSECTSSVQHADGLWVWFGLCWRA